MNYIKLSFFLLVVFASLAGAPQVFAYIIVQQTDSSGVMQSSGTFEQITSTATSSSIGVVPSSATPVYFQFWLQTDCNATSTCLNADTKVNLLRLPDNASCFGYTLTQSDKNLLIDNQYHLFQVQNNNALNSCVGYTNFGFNLYQTGNSFYPEHGHTLSNSSMNIPYFVVSTNLLDLPDLNVTRIIDVDPNANSTVASSTPTTVGATYYVSDSDFDDDMTLEIEVRNNAQNASQLVGPIFSLFQEQRFIYNYEQDITSSGLNSYASSTLFTQVGRYTAETKIKKPLFSVFGFGLFSQTVVATTTQFLVATTTAFDALQDGNIALAGQLAGVTGNLDCDGVLTSLSPRKFIACMFFFDYTGLQTVMNEARTGFLTSWPLGYGTRFVSILTDSATSSLPAINYTFGTTSPLYVLGLTSIDLDPFAELSDPENIVNTKSDQAQQKSVMEIMSQIVNIIVYLALAFMIIHDLTNVMKHHHRK